MPKLELGHEMKVELGHELEVESGHEMTCLGIFRPEAFGVIVLAGIR